MKRPLSFLSFRSLRSKMLISLGLLLLAMMLGLNYLNYVNQSELITGYEQDMYATLQETINNAMDQQLNTAKTSILSVVSNPQIPQAFAEGDREQLTTLLLPVFNQIEAEGVVQFQFHTPPAMSFLRLHSPNKYGDDLSSFRFTVLACNQEKRTILGLEEGKGGYGFRVVVPVEYNGQHVGSAEYGLDFGNSFLTKIQQIIPGDYYIYRLPADTSVAWEETGGNSLMLAGTTKEDTTSVPESLIKDLAATGK